MTAQGLSVTVLAMTPERRKEGEDEHNNVRSEQYRRSSRRDHGAVYTAIRFGIAAALVLLWAFAYLRAVFDPKYNPPSGIGGGVVLAAATYLFGVALFQGRKDD